jgi:ribonuclease T2
MSWAVRGWRSTSGKSTVAVRACPAQAYYRTARQAFETVVVPDFFARVERPLELPASVIEDAFLEANPALGRDQITITCKDGLIQEVRLCLTPELAPRRCGRRRDP